MADIHFLQILRRQRWRLLLALLVSLSAHALVFAVLFGPPRRPDPGAAGQIAADRAISVQVALEPRPAGNTQNAAAAPAPPAEPRRPTDAPAGESQLREPRPLENREVATQNPSAPELPPDPAGEGGLPQAETADDAGAVSTPAEDATRAPRRVQPRPLGRIAPRFPLRARVRGWSGETVLAVSVSEDGTVSDLDVALSSGHDVLDRAALAALEDVRFRPGTVGGRPVPMEVRIGLAFELEREE